MQNLSMYCIVSMQRKPFKCEAALKMPKSNTAVVHNHSRKSLQLARNKSSGSVTVIIHLMEGREEKSAEFTL